VVAKRTGLPFFPVSTPILVGAAVMANARLLASGRWHPSITTTAGRMSDGARVMIDCVA